MAKQGGPILITGLCGNICFYRMEGKYYVRRKSSLSGKRVKADPAFAGTMQYADLLANASKISSAVYRSLPEGAKTKGLYRKLTGKAMQWLKAGHDPEVVMVLLREEPEPVTIVEEEKPTGIEHVADNYAFADAVIASIGADRFADDTEILLKRHSHAPPQYIPGFMCSYASDRGRKACAIRQRRYKNFSPGTKNYISFNGRETYGVGYKH